MIYLVTLIFGFLFYKMISAHIKAEEERHRKNLLSIDTYQFPKKVIDGLKKYCNYNNINIDENSINLIISSLKQYFKIIYLQKKLNIKLPHKNNIGMPSKITDELWHLFIEDKKAYANFCNTIFDKEILHFKNETAQKINNNYVNPKNVNPNISNIVFVINKIKNSNIELQLLNSIPLLFAIDSYLKITDGYYYDAENYTSILTGMHHYRNESSDGGSSCGGGLSFSEGDGNSSGDSGGDGGSSCGGGD